MGSPTSHPSETFPKHLLVRLGLIIGVIGFTMTVIEHIPQFLKSGITQDIPFGALTLWAVWILLFIAAERFWLPKPKVLPMPPETMRKNRLYSIAIIILAIINAILVIVLTDKLQSGASDDLLPVMLAIGIVTAITIVTATLYFIFIMDWKESAKKSMPDAVPDTPWEAPAPVITAPVLVLNNLTLLTTFTGMLRNPQLVMAALKERSLISSFGYFILMMAASSGIMLATLTLYSHHSLLEMVFETLQMTGTYIGAWIYIGLIAHILVRMQGVFTGIGNTFHSLFYASTPFGVIGWIPFIGFLAPLWGIYHLYCGMTENQNVPHNYALTSAILATGGYFVLAVLTIIFLASFPRQ